MNEMITRVARVLCVEDGGNPDERAVKPGHGPVDYFLWQQYEGPARAAIEAMKEPTEGMIEAGSLHEGWTEPFDDDEKLERMEDGKRNHQYMMKAALEE